VEKPVLSLESVHETARPNLPTHSGAPHNQGTSTEAASRVPTGAENSDESKHRNAPTLGISHTQLVSGYREKPLYFVIFFLAFIYLNVVVVAI